ncbi:hypothetical protein RIF29_30107 [Crotalaria pallida]|uniref:Uncharacterized protein n=1 Tax=Crotalaria pallida TaxID=3830 RepID=A0AAN9EMK5_CROPI
MSLWIMESDGVVIFSGKSCYKEQEVASEEEHEEVNEEAQQEDPQDEDVLNMEWDEDEVFFEPDDMHEDFEVLEPEDEEVIGKKPV